MKEIFESVLKQMDKQQDIVLVTIVAGSGSTPRGAGARMWVSEDGSFGGTIGGGNVEHQSFLRAKELLVKKESMIKGFNLSQNDTADIGMICGGQIVVCFQYLSYRDEAVKSICQKILEQYEKPERENVWIIMNITDEIVREWGFYTDSLGICGLEMETVSKELLQTRASRIQIEDKLYYSEPLMQAGTVYIFGAGHVAKELVPVLAHLDFTCVVLDDRKELLKAEHFPMASKRLLCDFSEIDKVVHMRKDDYVVIMTRGHLHDYILQSQALSLKPKYIGVIGSRNKIAIVTKKLMADGYSRDEIEQCHMPIGVDIKAETPAEIAISIAAELIHIRKGYLR